MQENWRTFLLDQNATIENDQVAHFDDPATELAYTQSGTILTDLSCYGLLRFKGEDAQSFLQNQLSCDIREVNLHQGQYGSYCTPKGRVLTNFVVLQNEDSWLLQLPAELCASIQKRLSMFILRSKVVVDDCSDEWLRIGVAGPQSVALVEAATGVTLNLSADSSLCVAQSGAVSIICHSPEQLEILIAEVQAVELWRKLSESARSVGIVCWRWWEIHAGIPMVTAATQEQFLPQMINLDLIGGVSFKKGCYPGQEIVARTQYLGKLKRRMYLAHVMTESVVAAGDDIFCADVSDQSCGTIVNAVSAPDGGYDVLAVIQKISVASGSVYLHNPGGPELKIGALPYTLD